MAHQIWQPPDISGVCAEAHNPLTQCSQTGFMFLALVTQLFGGSSDSQYRPDSAVDFDGFGHLGGTKNGVSRPLNSFGIASLTSPAFETSIQGPNLGPFRSNSIRPAIESATPELGLVLEKTPFEGFESQLGGQSLSTASFYMKKENEPKLKFGLGRELSRISLGPKSHLDLKFRTQFGDVLAADSKKVTVKDEEKRKSNRKRRKKRREADEYDFIIVGAGSAGCVLANRLSEVKKWKILLLEAGSEEPEVARVPAFAPTLGSSSIDWLYRTQPEELSCRAQRGHTCSWFRGKCMGGSSAINYMVYMRGNKKDYDFWAETGNHGWSYKEVLPYFKKAENNQDIEAQDKFYHSVGGPLNVERYPYIDVNTLMLVQAFKEKGLPITDFNGAHQLGTDIAQSTSWHGTRWTANRGYIQPIEHKRPNLHIVKYAFATKIIIDPYTKTAHGVEYFRNGQYYSVYANKEVIVSAGALNSPKLLMLSGVGPKAHLESLNIPVLSDLKVGSNLQDHVTTDALVMGLSNKTSTSVDGEQLLNYVYDYHQQGPKKHGPLSSTSTLSAVAFIKTGYEVVEDVPDIQFQFDGRNVRDFYGDPTSYIASNIFPLSFYDGLAARPLLLAPKSRGFIMLNYTDPVFGPPLIYPKFFTEKIDVDRLVASIRFAVSLEQTEAFRLSGVHYIREPIQACAHHPWGTYEYFVCLLTSYTSTVYHPAGTNKMGPKWDKEAVVDPRLRVYGIKKLRVIDSSIMPVIVRGNLNAPTIMIAEKGADMIKADWIL